MKTMINQILDYAFPIGGGITGALIQVNQIPLLFPTWDQIVGVIILSFLGAFAGLIAKKIWDLCIERKKPKDDCGNK